MLPPLPIAISEQESLYQCAALCRAASTTKAVWSFHFSLVFSLFNEFSNFKNKKASFLHLKIWQKVLRGFLHFTAVLFKNPTIVFKITC